VVAKLVAIAGQTAADCCDLQTSHTPFDLQPWRVVTTAENAGRTTKETGGQEVPGSNPGSPTRKSRSVGALIVELWRCHWYPRIPRERNDAFGVKFRFMLDSVVPVPA
jgi:hypothetical protein